MDGLNVDVGQPYLQLPKEGITGGLSISHDGEYVVAMAMLPRAAEKVVDMKEAVAVHG